MQAAIMSAIGIALFCGSVGCTSRESRTPSEERRPDANTLPTTANPVVHGDTKRTSACFHVQQSVFARTPAGPSVGPRELTGWVVLDGREGASLRGTGRLVDSDGQTMQARWDKADTLLTVIAADDFLRVVLRFRESSDSIHGRAEASSDAAVERNAAGVMQEFRRTWDLQGHRRECATVPSPRTDP